MSTETGRPAAPASLTYLPQLDGLRGFAVVLVVIYHCQYLTAGWGPRPFPGGFIGVDLFFALSGFLITTILLGQLQRRGRIDFGEFWTRRIRRLVPALVVAVIGVIALVVLFNDNVSVEALRNSGIGSVLFVSNWQQASGWPYQFELSHTWSLAVEAQFYLVWPLVIIAFAALRVPRKVFAGIVVASAVAVAVHRWRMWTGQAHFLALYVRTDTRADVILLGCLGAMAVSWGWLDRAAAQRLRVLAVAALGLILFVCLDFETGDSRLYHGWFSIVAVSGAVLVTSAVLDPDWVVHRWWRHRVLMVLGQRSYSLYLWHVPIFLLVAQHLGDRPVWLRLVAGFVPVAVLTELSYRFVENRYRHFR
ncbi:MAG TPA: acyltransferase [Acidimicrobiia bacterium]|nr:acyltransferase [Acidimicrobiia bacterium]